MKNHQSLSVLIPNYNHAHYLPYQLDSMINQSIKPLEIIIIDDASTDESIKVIKSYMKKTNLIKLHKNNKNFGVEYNINKLIKLAKGDYIFLSAADDLVLPNFFKKSLEILLKNPSIGCVSSIVNLIGPKGENRGVRSLPIISKKPIILSPKDVLKKLEVYGRWIAISSLIMKREYVLIEGCQNQSLGSFADNFLAIIISLKYGACFIPENLSCWRQSKAGYGSSSVKRPYENLNQAISIMKLINESYSELFSKNFLNNFCRHWFYIVGMNSSHLNFNERIKLLEHEKVKQLLGYKVEYNSIKNFLAYNLLKFYPKIYFFLFFAPKKWLINGRLSILKHYQKIIIRENYEV